MPSPFFFLPWILSTAGYPYCYSICAMRTGSVLRALGFSAGLSVLGIAVAFSGESLDRRRHPPGDGGGPIYLPKAQYLRPLSLGSQNVLADLLWFRTISYFGEHYRSNRTYPWLAYMCDLVTDLDPRAEHVYRFAGVILPWEAGQADAGIRLLEKGIRTFPDSWLLHYHLGFHYYFFKDDYKNAVKHLRRAAGLPGVHPTIAQLAAVLAAEQYGPETTLRFLTELEQSVESEEVREVVRENMREAQLAMQLDRLTAAVERYKVREGRIPGSVVELAAAQIIAELPIDPFGGTFLIDQQTGAVRSSSGKEPSRVHQSKRREQMLREESARNP